MNASEMTNGELAELIAEGCGTSIMGHAIREAARRLRTNNSKVIAELQRRLKVAEDALAKLQDRLVCSVHDGTIDPHEALEIAENALAAIRGEGGAE